MKLIHTYLNVNINIYIFTKTIFFYKSQTNNLTIWLRKKNRFIKNEFKNYAKRKLCLLCFEFKSGTQHLCPSRSYYENNIKLIYCAGNSVLMHSFFITRHLAHIDCIIVNVLATRRTICEMYRLIRPSH